MMLLLTATLTVSVAAACGDDSNDLPPPPATPPGTGAATPGLDLTAEEAQAVAEAQATFDDFMTAYIEVSTADLPSPEEAEDLFFQVDQYAAGQLSQDLRTEIVGRWSEGHVAGGTIDWNLAAVDGVDLDNEVDGRRFPNVHLSYCINTAAWQFPARDGNESVDAEQQQLWRYGISWSDDWFGQSIEGWRLVEQERQGAC